MRSFTALTAMSSAFVLLVCGVRETLPCQPALINAMPSASRVFHHCGAWFPPGTSVYVTSYPFAVRASRNRRLASRKFGPDPPNVGWLSWSPTSSTNRTGFLGQACTCDVSHSYGWLLEASAPRQNAPLC